MDLNIEEIQNWGRSVRLRDNSLGMISFVLNGVMKHITHPECLPKPFLLTGFEPEMRGCIHV